MPDPRWFFPDLNGGEESGLNEAGIQSFKHVDSLARETVQNILDHPDKSGMPRVAEFEYVELPASEFPGLEQFTSVFKACSDFVLPQLKGKKVGNEENFFAEGFKVLGSRTIPVLRIGDLNTTGLEGDDLDRNKSFYRLLRGQGFSTSEGKGGGTYGIGQRAPFAYSALRTILYSTRLVDGSTAFVAKAILSSHRAPENAKALRQAKGWWCVPVGSDEVWRALRSDVQIPARFRRKAVGTDLYVTGFVQHVDWEQQVRHSVLRNFFAAIESGDLVIRILKNGSSLREIDKDNLEQELFAATEEARKSEKSDDWRSGLLASLYYYKALKMPMNGKPFEQDIPRLGKCQLFVFRDPNDKYTPQSWGTMRAPRMLVAQHGSQMLDHYAAVFLCDTEEGNDYLARLEDLAHTQWHHDELRNCTESERRTAKKVISEIRAFVRDKLKGIAGVDSDKPQDVPLLGKYLPGEAPEDEAAPGVEGGGATAESAKGEPRLDKAKVAETVQLAPSKQPLPLATLVVPEVEPVGGEGGGGPSDGGEGGESTEAGNKGPGPSEGGEGKEGEDTAFVLSAKEIRFRSYVDGPDYVVVLHPLKTVKGMLRIVAVGERGLRVPVAITSAQDSDGTSLKVSGAAIEDLELHEAATRRIRVSIAQDLGQGLCLGMGA